MSSGANDERLSTGVHRGDSGEEESLIAASSFDETLYGGVDESDERRVGMVAKIMTERREGAGMVDRNECSHSK